MGLASFGLSLLRGREASVNIRREVKRFTFGFDGKPSVFTQTTAGLLFLFKRNFFR